MDRVDVLIVEDVDTKFNDVAGVVQSTFGDHAKIVRAKNLNDADDLVMSGDWSLLVLDLSMDIAASGSMDLGSGHATLAGLDVVDRLALMKIAIPTVIITGFDSFQDPDRFDNAIMGVEEVNALAINMLGADYLGCVRYGHEDWKEILQSAISRRRVS
ncbi:hypothetical protein [Brevundimonas viscosa]|uniref:hypothetical protein n=1 Tax=Brevundimonas viscosa TaxID=871741 RepID=UPI0011607339|nr:hypothetical protein [Brevundimonas viscosa]